MHRSASRQNAGADILLRAVTLPSKGLEEMMSDYHPIALPAYTRSATQACSRGDTAISPSLTHFPISPAYFAPYPGH
jgi:hypothetical protein